jgi:hypothetical protein
LVSCPGSLQRQLRTHDFLRGRLKATPKPKRLVRGGDFCISQFGFSLYVKPFLPRKLLLLNVKIMLETYAKVLAEDLDVVKFRTVAACGRICHMIFSILGGKV